MQIAPRDSGSGSIPVVAGSQTGLAERILGRIGQLQVRLARNPDEVEAAQQVRFRVFHEEQGARFDAAAAAGRRDADRFDAVCDHLLVLDTTLPGPDRNRIVGTYRLLRRQGAAEVGGFYSEGEYDIRSLIEGPRADGFLELGRSCVLPAYRTKRTIEVLWQGIWAYVLHHGITVMGGCASLRGVIPAEHAEVLSFLAHNCRVEPAWEVRALPHRYCTMDLIPPEAIDARSAFQRMPPLLKGYLRLGARIGDGCVIDPDFRTVDVFVVLPVESISPRYITYYSPDAMRFVA